MADEGKGEEIRPEVIKCQCYYCIMLTLESESERDGSVQQASELTSWLRLEVLDLAL